MSRAMLVSSCAARVAATVACERSCSTIRKPSTTPIRQTMISRWRRAVCSADRLSIFLQERRIEGWNRGAGGLEPAESEAIDPVAALELGELVGIADAAGERGGIAKRGH